MFDGHAQPALTEKPCCFIEPMVCVCVDVSTWLSVLFPLVALPKPSDIWVKVVLMIVPHWKLVFTSLPPAANTCQMFWPP